MIYSLFTSERSKVIVDLDGTLTVGVTNEMRPGAAKLIKELSDRGDLVLWTSGGKTRLESFLSAHPELSGIFSQIFSRNNWVDEDNFPKLPPEFHSGDLDIRDRAGDILLGFEFEGGKLPPLVDSTIVIDDTAPWMQDAAKKFGFKAIATGSKRNDPTADFWVA